MRGKSLLMVSLLLVLTLSALSAQSAVKGNSINGATGIIVSPTARIGWEYSDLGLDFGYTFLYDGRMGHVPAFTLSFLKKAEVGVAFSIGENSNFDILYHGKFQFFRDGGSAVAMGLKGELTNVGDSNSESFLTPYLVATYGGSFFKWPATTTIMFGWNMLERGQISSNFSFSMGFELSLAPEVFKNYVYWISDFSNYSYSANSYIADNRGTFNTGLRIDPIKKGKFKLVFDFVGTDILDESRGFLASANFGMGF